MKTFITLLLLLSFGSVRAADLFIEAESFSNKGGWKVDQQFMDLMGSPYLLAHGMGVPVDDASTEVTFPEKGEYYVYVRTYNWTSPWKKGEGPGKFSLSVGGKKMTSPLGAEGSAWMWQIAGKVSVKNRRKEDDFSIGSGGFCLDVADSRKGVCQESENCNQIA